MKKQKKYLVFFLILFVTVLVSSVINANLKKSNYLIEKISEEDFSINSSDLPKASDYLFNLTGSKIFIDDSDPEYNWAKTKNDYPWCSGSGTWSDPYVIENVYIDGLGSIAPTPDKIHSENCLSVYSSTVPFVVKNCWFHNAGDWEYNSGVYLRTVRNGLIYNCSITYCHEGIYIDWYSENNTALNCKFVSDHSTAGYGKAVHIDMKSHNSSIIGSNINNYYDGICAYKSNYIVVDHNYAKNTLFDHIADTGIYLRECHYSRITYNVLAEKFADPSAEFVVNEINCFGCIVENNTVEGGPVGSGISGSIALTSLRTQGAFTSLIGIEDCNYTLVSSNRLLYEQGGDNVEPVLISGYDIFVLIGVVSVVSLLIIEKRSKK